MQSRFPRTPKDLAHLAARLILLTIILGGALAMLINRDRFDLETVRSWVQSAGWAGPVVYVGFYAVVTVFFFPGSLLTVASGTLFGPVLGALYSLTGATLGAVPAFLISRYVAGDWIRHTLDRRHAGRLKVLLDGVDNQGWRFVAFMRFAPILPLNLLNYALGLTRIGVWPYFLATYICMLPGAFAYAYMGHAGGEMLQGSHNAPRQILIALSLFGAIITLSLIFRKRLRPGPRPTPEKSDPEAP